MRRPCGGFWLVSEESERELRGVEELAGAIGGDGVDEDAVTHAGNEVANALIPVEQRHGPAVGLSPVAPGQDFIDRVVFFERVQIGLDGALVGRAASADGDAGGREGGGGGRDGGRNRFDQGEAACGFLGHKKTPQDHCAQKWRINRQMAGKFLGVGLTAVAIETRAWRGWGGNALVRFLVNM